MCGIAGFCNWEKNPEENIERMKKRMLHRGPDAGGTWKSGDGRVVFGHRRLSILDLSEAGAQPMTSPDGRFTICYNGEIYNYREVADRLRREGRVQAFAGTSDTEVLLAALASYGVEAGLRLCKGMFAAALYDAKEQTLSLFRDRAGEKPLYYGFVKGSFVFASDIGSIAALEGFSNPVDRKVLPLYLAYGYLPVPYTIYEDIRKLEPGSILTVRAPYGKEDLVQNAYWSMRGTALKGQLQLFDGSEEEAAEELEGLLREAIRGQQHSDVPLGAFLSAGVDSPVIVALMQDLSPEKVHTFTIGMEDAAYDEAEAAGEIAKHLGTDHTQLYISEREARAVIPELARMYGEPFGDSSQIPTYLVSKLTRQHVTVSLSGDAGDELFGGYRSYDSAQRIWNKLKRIPYPLRKAVGTMAGALPLGRVRGYQARLMQRKSIERVHLLSNFEDPAASGLCLDETFLPHSNLNYPDGYLEEELSNLMLMDLLQYLPDDILVKVDRAGMAVSLETRIPFLDRDVMEFAWSLPLSYKRRDGVTKRVTRDILYRYVPKELLDRPKKGFSVPIAKWLLEPELRAWAQSLLDPVLIRQQGFFRPEAVERLWKDFTEKGIWRAQIWYLLMFEEWYVDHAV